MESMTKINAFQFSRANEEDLPEICRMVKLAREIVPVKEWFEAEDNLGEYQKISREERKRMRYLMATVHPDNIYSLHNMEKLGMKAVLETKKYGGKRRYVMSKTLEY